jgi:predicted nucleic acid-binding protein
MSNWPRRFDVVVDASVAVQWYLPEAQSEQAEVLLDESYRKHVPELLYLEVASVLWKRCHQRGEISAEEVAEIRGRLDELPLVGYASSRGLLDEAVKLALKTGRTVYDCVYLAMADLLDCPLVTADRKLVNAMVGSPTGIVVQWIGDGPPE